MSIWDEALTVVLGRSSAGHTATMLGDGDAVVATCDDAGTVRLADGSTLMTAPLSWPRGNRSRPTEARVEVIAADGTAAGTLEVRRYTFTPFSKKITIALLDPSGAEMGDLSAVDKKARQLAITCGGMTVASLVLDDRDRGIARTVERWSLTVETRPPADAELVAAAVILRYGKVLAEVANQSNR